jgi:flagellar basal-body rod modification protein FlgD
MSRIPNIGLNTPDPQSRRGPTDLRNFDMSHFLDLMIAELQNQDPLNPMDNSEMLRQISQIREISATNQLTETLQSVLHGQRLTTAGALIGKEIDALGDDQRNIRGVVDRVSIQRDPNDEAKQTLRVHVGGTSVSLENIREIVG